MADLVVPIRGCMPAFGKSRPIALVLLLLGCMVLRGAPAPPQPLPPEPLSLAQAIDLAVQQNPALLRARQDVEAATGLVIQTRAVALPRVSLSGNYQAQEPDSVDRPDIPIFTFGTDQSWAAGVRVVQSIYEGGRLASAWRTSRLIREQSMLLYEAALADTILAVQQAYYGVLLATQNISVQEQSIELLESELADTQKRFNAGTVPRFNVLRAEVELANARPRLIRARNALRIGRNNLLNLLGVPVEAQPKEEVSLHLSGSLDPEPFELSLPEAIRLAWERRSELGAMAKAEALRQEEIIGARAGYRPSLQAFAGYDVRSSLFSSDLSDELHGWVAGVQATWNLFDGGLTRGRVRQAEALRERAAIERDETRRRIELQVRTEHSYFMEAREVLASQTKVQEQAEEALRLATARSEAGTGTQLDVLSAQTALTEARTTRIQALHDYVVARARLERAAGLTIPKQVAKETPPVNSSTSPFSDSPAPK